MSYQQYVDTLPDVSLLQLYSRTVAALPFWFGNSQTYSDNENSTILNVVLAAYLTTADLAYQQLQFVLLNDRLGVNFLFLMQDVDQLNLFAQDFFGNGLPRQPNESNDNYKLRISANLFNIKATRQGMFDALLNLTGFAPIIFEPWSIFDAMVYDGYHTGQNLAHSAYGVGKYGSEILAYTGYIDVFVPNNQGLGNYPGYDLPQQPDEGSFPPYPDFSLASYGLNASVFSQVYGSESLITQFLTFDQIAQVINQTKVFGTKVWFNVYYINP